MEAQAGLKPELFRPPGGRVAPPTWCQYVLPDTGQGVNSCAQTGGGTYRNAPQTRYEQTILNVFNIHVHCFLLLAY